MAKKKNNNTPQTNPAEEEKNPYELRTDAVDRLVNADNITYPKLTLENDPRRKYQSSFLARIPTWIKALFLKLWFGGAVCFFILWGLGMFVPNMTDMLVIMAVVLGMVTDLLVNPIFRFFATTEGANDKWMMFPKKGYASFFLNIVYAFIPLIIVVIIYNIINVVMENIAGTEGIVHFGVEPIMFGLLYMGADMLLIGAKNLFLMIIKDAKKKSGIK